MSWSTIRSTSASQCVLSHAHPSPSTNLMSGIWVWCMLARFMQVPTPRVHPWRCSRTWSKSSIGNVFVPRYIRRSWWTVYSSRSSDWNPPHRRTRRTSRRNQHDLPVETTNLLSVIRPSTSRYWTESEEFEINIFNRFYVSPSSFVCCPCTRPRFPSRWGRRTAIEWASRFQSYTMPFQFFYRYSIENVLKTANSLLDLTSMLFSGADKSLKANDSNWRDT